MCIRDSRCRWRRPKEGHRVAADCLWWDRNCGWPEVDYLLFPMAWKNPPWLFADSNQGRLKFLRDGNPIELFARQTEIFKNSLVFNRTDTRWRSCGTTSDSTQRKRQTSYGKSTKSRRTVIKKASQRSKAPTHQELVSLDTSPLPRLLTVPNRWTKAKARQLFRRV